MKKIKKVLLIILLVLASSSLIACDGSLFPDGDPIIVDVNTPTGVTVTLPPNSSIIEVGQTVQLTAVVAPLTAIQTVTWSSNNDLVASVDANGLVTAIGEGRVKITAISSKTDIVGYTYLTVVLAPIEVTAISISGPNEVHIDETIKLNYLLTPETATTEVTWSVDNQELATIDENGRITGIAEGLVNVTATTSNQISNTYQVNILARSGTPESISILGRSEIEVGKTAQLIILATPVGSLNDVTWESSNPEVASIDQNGLVTAISEGTTNIAAISSLDNLIQATFSITTIDNTISEDLQQAIIDVIANTKSSILGVSNYVYDTTLEQYKKSSIGSGFVYEAWFVLKDGSIITNIDELITFDDVEKYCYYLVTNKHVVEGSDALKIYLSEEDKEIGATLMQYDDKVDLAVVYFEHDRYLQPLVLADSDLLNSGEFAIAIGNPSGYEYSSSATFGIISHPKRYISDDTDNDGISDWDAEYIQHDVAINPGNSGGPLLNLQGEVIGVNTMKFAATDIDNMGFSIPSNVVSSLVDLLEQGLKPTRAKIGVTVIEVIALLESPDPEIILPEGATYGLYVSEVAPGSVGANGGVLPSDIILTFNGVELFRSLALRAELGKIIVGSNQEIEITVLRNGEIITLTLIF
ncbi:MAG: Ig-like domain-containing protein [Bacilli bacterium]